MSGQDLGSVFTLKEARSAGISKDRVYALLDGGEIERVGRGVYIRADVIPSELSTLVAASALRADATLCLTSALVHHGLSDAISFAADIALPRGTRHPSGFSHVSWHSFDQKTFQIGRDFVEAAEGARVSIYSAERTIVDCFRLMHNEGSDVAYEALRRWLRTRGHTPARLLDTARAFPKALPKIRLALEILG